MPLPSCLQRVNELNENIENRRYGNVRDLLNDPEVPVNLGGGYETCYKFAVFLPLAKMLMMNDGPLARVFLNCSRIDWLAMTWNRNLLKIEKEFGIQYEPDNVIVSHVNKLEYFYYLDESFEKNCPEEAKNIYEKIIYELLNASDVKQTDLLLPITCKSAIAFEIALKYCKNVNIKDGQGRTALHLTSDSKVLQMLFERGANVNVLDDDEFSPLMTAAAFKRWNIMQLLIEHGVDLDFINSKKESCFTVCYDKIAFLNLFGVSKKVFVNELENGNETIKFNVLCRIFERYPEFEGIFQSNLPVHLASIQGNAKWNDLYNKLDRDESLSFVKDSIRRGANFDFDKIDKDLVETNANEFFQVSIEAGNLTSAERLLTYHKADPNLLINRKTALFSANGKLIDLLLKHGADPNIKCDGALFFEERVFKSLERSDTCWLLTLVSKGFDLFRPAEKSGKSLIDCFEADAKFSVILSNRMSVSISVKQLSSSLFQILNQDQPDLLAPIDEDGKTLIHYLDLDGMHFNFKVSSINEFKRYADIFLSCHGVDIIKEAGGRFVFGAFFDGSQPNFTMAKYLIDSGVCLNRIMGRHVLGDYIFKTLKWRNVSNEIRENCTEFLLQFGAKLANESLRILIEMDQSRFVETFIDECSENDIIQCIKNIVDSYEHDDSPPFNDAYRAFFSNPKVLQSRKDDFFLLDRYFFDLCSGEEASVERTKFFLQLGVDFRRHPEVVHIDAANFYGLAELREAGWTLQDLKNHLCYDRYYLVSNLYEEFSSIDRSRVEELFMPIEITAIEFNKLSLHEVIGDKDSCAICKGEFESQDEIILLSCKHVFHAECSRSFLLDQYLCPYCRSPLTSPNPPLNTSSQ